VLFAGRTQRPWITACGPKAERLGVHVGQSLAEAKAMLPRAVYIPTDAAADQQALCQLALDCQRFSPLVGLEEGPLPESLLCDVTGCTHLWGEEELFLKAVRDYWLGRGCQIQLALARTLGAAWALAHTRAAAVVPAGEEEVAIARLSVAALRLPPTSLERLEALGLATIGDVLKLPRETLASRFGEILPRRLDQVLGLLPETFVCERLKEPLTAIREWETPIDDRFALDLVCRQMVRELLAMADRHGLGLQEIEGNLQTETGQVTIEIRLARPTKDERHLSRILELQFERQTWSGGVVAVRWSALRLGRLDPVQGCWFGDEGQTEASRDFIALIDRLSSRLDAKSVLRVEMLPDPQPEYAVRLVPWTNVGGPKTTELTPDPEQSRGRPFRLLGDPQRLEVASAAPDGPPLRMTWRGEDHLVVRSWGPERIATGWWREQDVQRDYYRAEWDDGTHVWVYLDQCNSRWFLHGFFD
jgi:protein ImuB